MLEQKNHLKSTAIIEYYKKLSQRPQLYLHPVTPDVFFSHAMSLAAGVQLSVDTIGYDDFVSARQHAIRLHGWENRSFGPHVEMREKGYDDEEILRELISIEIQMWQILDQWQKENLSKTAPDAGG